MRGLSWDPRTAFVWRSFSAARLVEHGHASRASPDAWLRLQALLAAAQGNRERYDWYLSMLSDRVSKMRASLLAFGAKFVVP